MTTAQSRYHLALPLMGLAFRDNRYTAVTIQADEILKVVGPAQDDRFIVVDVRGERRLVFESDLKDRGKLVNGRKARTAANAAAAG